MTFSKLGTDNDTQQIVELSQASRRQGLYIIGANGTGKTGLIEHLILQDIDQGLGVGLLDPHGDLVNAILAKMTKREDDVILLDIQDEDHPFGLNMFECPNPQSNTAVQKIVDLVMHIFEKLYDVNRAGTPLLLDYLRNCTYTLVANPGYTMSDIPLLFTDQHCRQKLVANISEPYVKQFWQQYDQLPLKDQREEAASTMRRVREFLQPLSRNIVGQAKSTINMQQIMDERKILLVKLSAQLDQVTSLIGSVIIAMILNAAYSRASLPVNKRKQFNLYADEFQRFATEDFATLLTEARKFGIATTIAHQARYQPGMTDGIRAVSLQAANHVVFRVTSPDADELSGGFDVSPQAAWEEEIAKEWVEVLKPEWYERVEEEVIDGNEEIQTVVSTPLVWLSSGKTHPSPKVNQFVAKYITPDPNKVKWVRDGYGGVEVVQYPSILIGGLNHLDKFLFQVMVEKNPTLPLPLEVCPLGSYLTQTLQIDLVQLKTYMSTASDVRQAFHNLAPFFASDQELYTRIASKIDSDREYDRKKAAGYYPSYGHSSLYNTSSSRPNYKDYTDQMVAQAVADEVKKINEEKQQHGQFYIDLREMMQTLAIAPILEGSGIRQPRKRKQINYHTHPAQTITHPRKVIMHPQRTYQDVKNDIANQLSGFPNFTARVKLSEILSHNPGKKCRHCGQQSKSGDIFCSKCGKALPNEYTFTTLKPLGGLGKAALQQRLTTIQSNTMQKGYVQDRTNVEAEIIQRQTNCSGAAPAQPQKPQQQPSPQQQAQARHARQVPVQGHCPTCNATNPRGSKFCNNCGTKLP